VEDAVALDDLVDEPGLEDLPADVTRRGTPVCTHGDLQITHVFVDGDEVTGVLDWSGASQGDALFDLATRTLGHAPATAPTSTST
jgi:aminoglycoside phosphotransferase (APT) family kinase protein